MVCACPVFISCEVASERTQRLHFLCGNVLCFTWLFAFSFLRSFARAVARLGLTRGELVSNKKPHCKRGSSQQNLGYSKS